MFLKSYEKYLLIGVLISIFIFLGFCPIHPISIHNETMFSTFFGLTFYDGSVFTALLVGLGTILITAYNTNKNYKAMKLTAIPDKSTNLLIDLKYAFNKYEICKQKGKEDDFILLTEILKYWKEHQKAFALLTPCFYEEFIKIITTGNALTEIEKTSTANDEAETKKSKTTTEIKIDCSNPNSKYILKALIAQITNIAFENDECYFEFISPELIEDERNIRQLGENQKNYIRFKINTTDLEEYIKKIKGTSTHELTNSAFNDLKSKINKLMKNLKREIEEYD